MRNPLNVTIGGIPFKNPVIAASGTFGFGLEYEDFYDVSRLGGISLKGTTPAARLGNPPPRVAETPGGMLNSVGLQNPGMEEMITQELPKLQGKDTVVIANIAAPTVEGYAEIAARMDQAPVDMVELNISCPNVKEGGVAFGVSCQGAASVTKAVRQVLHKPLIVKLSPNVTDITAIAKAVEAEGADALSLINTLLGMRIDIESRRPILHNNVGGLSGPAVFPVALRMVWQAAGAVDIPIIGLGGIASWQDAVEMMLAGASAIQVGTAMFTDPYAPIKIIAGMEEYCREHGIANISEIVGQVRPYGV